MCSVIILWVWVEDISSIGRHSRAQRERRELGNDNRSRRLSERKWLKRTGGILDEDRFDDDADDDDWTSGRTDGDLTFAVAGWLGLPPHVSDWGGTVEGSAVGGGKSSSTIFVLFCFDLLLTYLLTYMPSQSQRGGQHSLASMSVVFLKE